MAQVLQITVKDALGNNVDVATITALLAATMKVDQVSGAYGGTATITRPADLVSYQAGDVVGGALTFSTVGPTAGAIIINGASLEYDVSALPSGIGTMRLYLYSATPPSALADNAQFALPSGDRPSFLGYIDLGSLANIGSTLFAEINGINKQLKLAAASTSLFGYLVTTAAFTPGSGDVLNFKLHAMAV